MPMEALTGSLSKKKTATGAGATTDAEHTCYSCRHVNGKSKAERKCHTCRALDDYNFSNWEAIDG